MEYNFVLVTGIARPRETQHWDHRHLWLGLLVCILIFIQRHLVDFLDNLSGKTKQFMLGQRIYHVGYTSSHPNRETLQGISPPPPPWIEYSLFRLSLSQSSDCDLLKQTNKKKQFMLEINFVQSFYLLCQIVYTKNINFSGSDNFWWIQTIVGEKKTQSSLCSTSYCAEHQSNFITKLLVNMAQI